MDNYYTEITQNLHSLGFNESEALVYVVLLQKGPLNGYQVAKESGVPRPNVYSILERLEKRGAVERVEIEDGHRYSALPAGDLIKRLRGEFDSRMDRLQKNLEDLPAHAEPDRAWNIEGRDAVLREAAKVIREARGRLHIGLTPGDAQPLAKDLLEAEGRGVDVTTLCFAGCERECGGCRGKIYRYPMAAEGPRWLLAAADDQALVLAQTDAQGSRAIRSRLGVLIALAVQYLQNAIAVAEIVRSMGARLPEMLDGNAAQALKSAGLGTRGTSWLDHLTNIVNRQKNPQ
jgi:HTH-type transcriptional regulator, sugar sensing transcriptional regulator